MEVKLQPSCSKKREMEQAWRNVIKAAGLPGKL